MLPAVIVLLALSIMAAAALVAVVLTDEDGGTQTVTKTRTIVLPAASTADIAAAKAMKDEAATATAISPKPEPSTPLSEGQKTDAANHALSVRSVGLQQMLEAEQPVQVGGHRVGQDEVSSGTAAKDEAGVAAAVGNP